MASTVVGLEITEESVRAVEIRRGKTPVLVAAGEIALPEEAARDSEVIDRDVVAMALRQLWSTFAFKGREVTLGVGSRRILVREYTTQAMAPEMLRQALPYQVQDLLPVPANQAVLDFYPVSQIGDQVSGLLVAAVAETIEQLIATTDRAKLKTRAVDLVPFGLARVAKRIAVAGDTIAMIHVGDHTSHVVIATDGVPHFVRILPADVATAAVRRRDEALNSLVDVPVEEFALETVPPMPASVTRTRAALRTGGAGDPSVADLVSRIRSTVSFFTNRPGAPRISAVAVSGAGFLAHGVSESLTRAFDVPVRGIHVADVVKISSGLALPEELAFNAVSTLGILLGEGN
ncbi:pilus assembly protein PilM [Microbacterium sp. 4R-513]|uniref:pilus assembly protein PilM n=1 Tax=Microbacterium sp. 4R-513 TaxID=2567934 RepID=UPI0013E114D9|nr:pilus assembly protein PilM [Microbacterium sp. 4R-513]QIG40934.1 pilus assembly protein PilM [Microbacterium sp. 4R-513]